MGIQDRDWFWNHREEVLKSRRRDPVRSASRGPTGGRVRWGNLLWTLRQALPWLLLVAASFFYIGERFVLAINDQVAKCLPPYTLFLIDRHDRRIDRDVIVGFPAGARMGPFFQPDLMVVKRAVGLPGDHIVVGATETRVNGMVVGEGLDLAATLGRPAADFVRTLVVPEGFVWIMGDTRDSFDSRYWGARPISDLIGRAWPLW
ncbi:MAG: signal peptidase I [Chromatiaceae bacterium]|nr:MAG: signal peptidase I [Chromatiaceae bacterium]